MKLLDRRTALTGLASIAGTAAFAAKPAARPGLYNCEGCEAVDERARETLSAILDLAGPDEPGERLILSGRVLKADGVTPAGDVVIYAHQTNAEGLYANGAPDTVWSRRHGRLRGWVRTGADGLYRFTTIKPAPYPDRTLPAHIHLFVGEPQRQPYYIDDVVFDGEPGINAGYRAAQELRGGSGIVQLARNDEGARLARRNIVLERHPA